jgi:large subunit ribosomal protein L9
LNIARTSNIAATFSERASASRKFISEAMFRSKAVLLALLLAPMASAFFGGRVQHMSTASGRAVKGAMFMRKRAVSPMRGKSEVVLTKDVADVGMANEVVVVKDGFFLNYLLPNGAAERASAAALERVAAGAAELAETQAADLAAAEGLKGKLEAVGTVSLAKKVGEEGKLFGSVSASDIVEALAAASGESLGSPKVSMEDISATGTYDVKVTLHAKVAAEVKVEITAEE